jgi:hypothetical protein
MKDMKRFKDKTPSKSSPAGTQRRREEKPHHEGHEEIQRQDNIRIISRRVGELLASHISSVEFGEEGQTSSLMTYVTGPIPEAKTGFTMKDMKEMKVSPRE